MKSTTYLLALFASVAIAAPAGVKRTEELDTCDMTSGGAAGATETENVENISVLPALCSLSTALCCASKATDAKSLDCVAPSTAPITVAGFEATCLATGKKHPRCCVLDVAGHAASCNSDVL
ncbi:hypothetical protein LZ30DRAFT_823263 [Colletotrichum cereale]|nr:hypothetical protein LZ30DRAFT_823263 [Colletotrichum cereale]